MRLKTQLVLVFTGLVVVMVAVLSALYLSQLLLQQVEQAYSSNDILAHQILFATRNALDAGVRNHPVNPKDPAALRETVAARPDFGEMRERNMLHLIRAVFGKPRVYNVTLGLERNNQPFLTVRVGIRSSFLSNSFQPRLIGALTFSGVAILSALLVSAFLANFALRPLAQISERLDALTQAETAGE